MRPTHKTDIIALYEQGLTEAEQSRPSQHTQTSGGCYIRDYERVKLLLKRRIRLDEPVDPDAAQMLMLN